MRVFEVLSSEKYRLDRFILRTMGSYTPENRAAMLFYNPSLDPLQLEPGQLLKVPSTTEATSTKSIRNLFLLTWE
jgi:hypothetical protein